MRNVHGNAVHNGYTVIGVKKTRSASRTVPGMVARSRRELAELAPGEYQLF